MIIEMKKGVNITSFDETKRVEVFGSSLSGIHRGGQAGECKRFYGAVNGVAEGLMTGGDIDHRSYALPILDNENKILTLNDIETHITTLINTASNHPDLDFMLPRLACAPKAYQDEDIVLLFKNKLLPDNVHIPYMWKKALMDVNDPLYKVPRIIVAGSREFYDQEFVSRALNAILRKYGKVIIVSGAARGADTLGENWAFSNGQDIIRMPAPWDYIREISGHHGAAGSLRNQRMSYQASGLMAFWSGEVFKKNGKDHLEGGSNGTRTMIKMALTDHIPYMHISIPSDAVLKKNKGRIPTQELLLK